MDTSQSFDRRSKAQGKSENGRFFSSWGWGGGVTSPADALAYKPHNGGALAPRMHRKKKEIVDREGNKMRVGQYVGTASAQLLFRVHFCTHPDDSGSQ